MLLQKKEELKISIVKAVVKKIKAIYVRVSTDSQVEGYSIDAQIELVTAYLKSKECTEFKVYTDPGYSGKDLNRPAIQQLIADIKEGKIETVLVFKLDRLSRSQKDTLYMIEEVFNKYDVGFISIRESFDTTTPFGKAMIGILSVFAQLERETIIERTRLGMLKRIQDGFWRGGGKIPFVYDYNKDTGILEFNTERKMIFDLMKTLRLQGMSYPQLEAITGLDQAWIQEILNCKTNLGLIPHKGELYKGRHKAAISQEEYDELQIIEENRSHAQRASHYLLSGKIYCAHCGAKYRYQKWGQRIICYCYSQQKSKPQLIRDPNCQNNRLDSFEIEDTFLEQLFEMSLDENKFNDTFDLAQADVQSELNTRLEEVQNQITNLINCMSKGIVIDDMKKRVDELALERDRITKTLEEEKRKGIKGVTSYESIKNLSKIWNQLEFTEQRNVVESLIDKVVVDKKKLKIYWKISNA